MTFCTFISSIWFYLLIYYTKDSNNLLWISNFIIVSLLLIKVPCFPFSIWLPEAHVEASWPGSTILAGFALKYAIIAIILFIITNSIKVEFIYALLIFSICFASLIMSNTIDLKKLIANFSVIHMCITVSVLLINYNLEFILNFSWHHHSIVTSWLFVLIGWVYAISSSRLVRLIINNINTSQVFLLIFYILLTFSLDLPWTSNFFIEFNFLKAYSKIYFIIIIFFIFFWILLIAFITISSIRSSKLNSSDSNINLVIFLIISSVITILLGYSIGYYYYKLIILMSL